MMIPEALVFDLDGTLIDSRKDIAVAVNHALSETGYPKLSEETIATFVGDGSRTLCARATGLCEDDPKLDEVLSAFLPYYAEHAASYTQWLPHAREALDALSSYRLALCTNKPREVTEVVLETLTIADRFEVVLAGGDTVEKKPDPEPLLVIAERLRLPPAALVMIGDGPQDIEAGRRAGTKTVGVRGGFPAIERLLAAKPDALIDSLAELMALLDAWRQWPSVPSSPGDP